jgi:hypothetical protein
LREGPAWKRTCTGKQGIIFEKDRRREEVIKTLTGIK